MEMFYEKLVNCTNNVKQKTNFKPQVALILGSGLGEYVKEMDIQDTIPYAALAQFPQSTVAGHEGRFLFGYVQGVPVVAMQGRVHYYEGYPMSDVVLPIRLMGLLGAEKVVLTNAAGGVNLTFEPGNLMLITDHITTFVPSPLVGPNIETLGTRFPDMSAVYDQQLRTVVKQAAKNAGVFLQQGVYVQFPGPAYETPAEIKMCRAIGGDAAGMSTACEAMAAHHMGMKVCGVSCITNMAAGITNQRLNHKEVQETADMVSAQFRKLITESIRLMGNDG